jgi:UDP-2,3-diacylglucosamine hydrolase
VSAQPPAPHAAEPPRVVAPPAWRALDFISDLHLDATLPRTFAAWADYLRGTSADAVFILGDLFEAWVGDDARHAGFEARCAAVLAEAGARRPVHFMVGNRDFLLGDEMLAACGLRGLADPTVLEAFGTRVLLAHGDALCLGDTEYRALRAIVRAPPWQRAFLARPLAEREAAARALRAESERHQAGRVIRHDVDRQAAVAALDAAQATTLIHGHTHRPGDERWSATHERRVLTDWDLDDERAPRAQVLRWRAEGFARLAPDEAIGPARPRGPGAEPGP